MDIELGPEHGPATANGKLASDLQRQLTTEAKKEDDSSQRQSSLALAKLTEVLHTNNV